MKSVRLLRPAAAVGLVLITLAMAPLLVGAQDVKYPRVNTALGYEVDAKWPQRPAGVDWDHVPGIAVDAHDNVYVFTRAEPPVQVYDAAGKFLRSWGDKAFKTAHHIRIDSQGHVWVADVGHHIIEKYTPEGKLLLTLGTKGKAGRDKDHFFRPTDMAVTPAGDIYVSDGYGNARIVQYDKSGKFVREWGELGHKPGMFSIPHSIVADSKGRLYVADRNNARIQVFDPYGKFLAEWRDLVVPWGLWITKDDELWVCGSSPMRWREGDTNLGVPPKDQVVMRFNTDGKLLQLVTMPKGADGLERPGELNWVHCIAADSRGNLYMGDIKGKRAQKFVVQMPDKGPNK
jgi:DNA-binding beta-propeller fold protein YncE